MRRPGHLGVAVRSLEEASVFYRGLGMEWLGEETLPAQGVRLGMLSAGGLKIELLEPLGPDTPVGRFIDKKGPGLHHLCFEVADIEAEMDRLRESGAVFIDEKPRVGAHGSRVAFLHPKSSCGVLVELRQP
jgi:methylmalonyl-CoA/ethylmalonyl-CoA epimerase